MAGKDIRVEGGLTDLICGEEGGSSKRFRR